MYKEHELSAQKINEGIDTHITNITKEFRNGFEFIKKFPKSVTIFGSSRLGPESSHYADAEKLGARIVKELGYSVVTGGGPGIMEAANKGARDAGGPSIGLNINIPHEQHVNSFTDNTIQFEYFFSRKAMLNFAAEAYVFFPGGFGTMDEFFDILTLIQTKKIPRIPIILYGKDFWGPVSAFVKKYMLELHHTIGGDDMNLFVITDSSDAIIKMIKEAPVSEWWKMVD